jgi:hypothetical protein
VSGYCRGAIETSKMRHGTSHYIRRYEPEHDTDIIHGLAQLYSLLTKTTAASCVWWGTSISHRANSHSILSSVSFLTGNEIDSPLFWSVLVRAETNGGLKIWLPQEIKISYNTWLRCGGSRILMWYISYKITSLMQVQNRIFINILPENFHKNQQR